MGKTAILSVKIISDAKQAAAGIDDASGKMSKLSKMAGMAKLALAGAAYAGGKFLIGAVKDAGELEQSVGAIDTVFGKSAGNMHKWSASAAQDVGLTKNEFNELGTLIGAQLKNGGTAMDELAPKTNALIRVGGDLSSMFGGSTKEAVEALSSALKGERDPIEKYGVSLNQAKIDAEAAALGFKKVGGSLDAEAQQAATLSLIMKQTKDAHGNFAKEAGTLAGQQQRLTAEWGNMKTTIGTALLPVLTKAFTWINSTAVPIVKNFLGVLKGDGKGAGFADKLGLDKLGPVLDAVSGYFQKVGPVVKEFVTGALIPLGQTIATKVAPILQTIITAVLPALAAAWAKLIPVVGEVVSALGPLIAAIAERLMPIISRLLPVVTTVFTAIVNVVKPVLSTLAAIIRTVTAAIKGDWSGAWNGIKSILSNAWTAIKAIVTGAISIIKAVLSAAWDGIKAAASSAWNGIKTLISGAWNGIKSVTGAATRWVAAKLGGAWTAIKRATSSAWNGIKTLISGAWNGIKSLVSGNVERVKALIRAGWNTARTLTSSAWTAIKSAISRAVDAIKSAVTSRINSVVTTFRRLPRTILGAVSGFGSLLRNAGRNLLGGLISGITSKISEVKSSLTGLTSKIPSWKGPIQKDKRLLEPAGAAIMGGLIRSIEASVPDLKRTLTGVTRTIGGTDVGALAVSTPRAGSRRAGAGVGAGGTVVNITINGALDPVSAGRQVRDLIATHATVTGVPA